MGNRLYILNVAGAIYRGDEYLVMRRSADDEYAAGQFSLVGGGIEVVDKTHPDVLRATLKREIMEEVGVSVDDTTYIMSAVFPYQDQTVLNMIFLCRYASGKAHPADPAEVASVHWFTAAQVAAHPAMQPWTKNYIAAAEQVRLTRV